MLTTLLIRQHRAWQASGAMDPSRRRCAGRVHRAADRAVDEPDRAAVASGLVALLAAFFGLAKDAPTGASDWLQRVIGFGVVGIIASLLGLQLRVSDAFAPSVDHGPGLTTAGFDKPEALAIVRYRRFGVTPAAATSGPADAVRAGAVRSTVLFGASAQTCSELEPRRFASVDETLATFARRGGSWAAVASVAGPLDAAGRARLVEAAWKLACEAS